VDVIGIRCYSSTDLVTWKDEGAMPLLGWAAESQHW